MAKRKPLLQFLGEKLKDNDLLENVDKVDLKEFLPNERKKVKKSAKIKDNKKILSKILNIGRNKKRK